jgi:DNA (cytosine-5)-methyltransferase 1
MSSGQANAEITRDISPALNCNRDGAPIAFPAEMSATQCASAKDVSPSLSVKHTTAVAYGIDEECNASKEHFVPLLRGGQGGTRQAVAFAQNTRDEVVTASGFLPGQGGKAGSIGWNGDATPNAMIELAPCMRAGQGGEGYGVMTPALSVRRLTPRECEKLQGFPENHTQIPWRGKPASQCPDGPRYKALGNSMAVNCMRWIGDRIKMVEELC